MAVAQHKTYPENDYTLIETALSGSKRGRWFLDQYVMRNLPTDTGQMLSSINRLANLVERQEETLQSILKPADLSLVKKALGIVEQYLSSNGNDTLVGLAHDLEQNANILSTASENLILAAASMKMGNVDDATFAQIVGEAERIQDAKRHTQSAKTKIATLFQALSMLEDHLRKLCNSTNTVENNQTSPEADLASEKTVQPVSEFEEVIISEKSEASQTEEITDKFEAISEDIQASSLNQTSHNSQTAEDIIQEADIIEQEEDIIDDHIEDHENDDDDDINTPDSGADETADETSEEMSEEDIEALFSASDIHGLESRSSEESSISMPFGVSTNAQALKKLAGEMVNRQKSSLQAKIAEQQLKFFSGNQGIKLKVKPA